MRNTTFHTLAVLACFLLGCVCDLRAHPITADAARQNALSYLGNQPQRRAKGLRQLTLAHTVTVPTADSHPLIYTFNIEGQNGFIFTSADDQTEPILGYCDTGQFVADSIPDNLRAWIDGWAEEIAWQQTHSDSVATPATPHKARKTINSLMKSSWGQNNPFNNHCAFSGRICAAGCVTLAMAQILYYWATVGKGNQYFRKGCTALPAYKTKTCGYQVDALSALSTFSWANMTDGTPKTTESKNAVAQLIRYCAQSIKTDFEEGASTGSTTEAVQALKHKFGYNFGMRMIYAKNMTATQWADMIYAELAASRPVIMTGEGNSNHAFVCDGYDKSTGWFHFNWGWAGYCDGWFAMSALNPATYYFNSQKSAVIDIQPMAASAYAVVSKDATTLSFYYDTKRTNRSGTVYELNSGSNAPGWVQTTTLKKVVFDSSFASYHPTTTYAWMKGQANLTTLSGLDHLDMSAVTSNAYMFYGCSSMQSIAIPLDFSVIGQHMFHGCTSLTAIEIPASVTSIDHYAFYGCSNLTSVTVHHTTPPTISSGVFTNRKNADLYIPAGYKKAYANSAYWKEFKNLSPFGFAPGDVNHDGVINVADIMATVNNVLGSDGIEFHSKEGDLNNDGQINVTDVMNIVGTVMDNSPHGTPR